MAMANVAAIRPRGDAAGPACPIETGPTVHCPHGIVMPAAWQPFRPFDQR